MLIRFFVLCLLACNYEPVGAETNLALHKNYEFSPQPNYPLCTDNSDVIQLTDGITSGSQWTQTNTVGWVKAEPVVEIVIDLGRVFTIDEVRIHTIGGGFASVEFPDFVAVLLSDDSIEFKFAGLVSSKELANIRSVGYQGVPHTLSIPDINATGRYVKLAVRPKGICVFIDEVEVLGNSPTGSEMHKIRDGIEVFDSYEELLSRIDEYLQLNENITTTIKCVEENQSQLCEQFCETILPELEILAQKVDIPTNNLYSTTQMCQIRGQLGKIRAGIYQAFYKKPFVSLPVNPMEIVFEKDMLLDESLNEISIRMWQNEYESAAFNVINCSDEAMKITVSISPLAGPDGQRIDSDTTFTIRRAVYVKASTVGSIADALVLQTERQFILQPGELTQIWLTVFNPTLTAGLYIGQISISEKTATSDVLPIETIPVVLDVQKKTFPENFALNTCNWAYYKVASMPETAEDLYTHHINVYIIPAQDLPFPRFASDPPGVVREPDFENLDRVLQHHNYVRTYLLGLSLSSSKKDYGRFGDVQWMTPLWKAVFSSWLKYLAEHLKDAGVDYNRFALYPFDESLCDEFYELATLIKSIDPNIRLYANSFGKGPQEFMRFRELIDIWCLQESHCMQHPEWLEQIKGFGKELWVYECLRPMKAKDPYSYYRLMPWRAFALGQTGAGFWTYYYGLNFDIGAVPWNDSLRPYGFSGVVYGSQASPVGELTEGIVPSRRWEAWREGVEDYQYLYELQQVINEIRTTDPITANQAQETLDNQVNRILNNSDNSDIVYDAREILSDTLLRLTK